MASRNPIGARPAPSAREEAFSAAHAQDFENLHLGHKTYSRHKVSLADLDVYVHGLDEIANSKLPISAIILSHGWANTAQQMEPMACGILGEIDRLAKASGTPRSRDAIVVTLDQRNHGERRRVKNGLNLREHPLRMVGIAPLIAGGMQDQQHVMDFLGTHLWPMDEREIVEFMILGVSMGGHQTWRLVRDDPRVRVVVPVNTTPSPSLPRIWSQNEQLYREHPPLLPAATRKWFFDQPPASVYRGKKILSLHGAEDNVVPFKISEESFPPIQAACPPGDVEKWIQPGAGHLCSPEMVQRGAEWFYRWGVA